MNRGPAQLDSLDVGPIIGAQHRPRQHGAPDACLDEVDSAAGRRRVADYLHAQPFPHYEAAPDAPGLLLRIEADGTRTVGRFINRKFRAIRPKPRRQ